MGPLESYSSYHLHCFLLGLFQLNGGEISHIFFQPIREFNKILRRFLNCELAKHSMQLSGPALYRPLFLASHPSNQGKDGFPGLDDFRNNVTVTAKGDPVLQKSLQRFFIFTEEFAQILDPICLPQMWRGILNRQWRLAQLISLHEMLPAPKAILFSRCWIASAHLFSDQR